MKRTPFVQLVEFWEYPKYTDDGRELRSIRWLNESYLMISERAARRMLSEYSTLTAWCGLIDPDVVDPDDPPWQITVAPQPPDEDDMKQAAFGVLGTSIGTYPYDEVWDVVLAHARMLR